MTLYTLVARASDGLVLCGSSGDSELSKESKQAAKDVIRSVASEIRSLGIARVNRAVTMDVSRYSERRDSMLNYCISERGEVVSVCLCSKRMDNQLVFAYLSEVNSSFLSEFGGELFEFASAYAAISFGYTLDKLGKRYQRGRSGISGSSSAMSGVNQQLREVHGIMQKNIEDVMVRGQGLDSMRDRSEGLRQYSDKFKKQSRWINIQAALQQYALIGVCLLIILLVLLFRYYY